MWYVVVGLICLAVGFAIASYCQAADSKPEEAIQRAYSKGLAEGPAYWRNRAARSDESARILGEGLKKAIKERDEARAVIAKMPRDCPDAEDPCENCRHVDEGCEGDPPMLCKGWESDRDAEPEHV